MRRRRIAKTFGVCGGRACVAGKRLPVWLLVAWRYLGMKRAALVGMHAGILPRDIRAAWRYARVHPEEVARDLRENDRADAAGWWLRQVYPERRDWYRAFVKATRAGEPARKRARGRV